MRLINNKKPSLIAGQGWQWVPGLNRVDDAVWETAKDTFLIKSLLAENLLVDETPSELVSPEKSDGKAPPSPEKSVATKPPSLRNIKPAQAVQLIAKTFDESLLVAWEAEDNRSHVLAAIRKQRALIEAETTKPSDNDADVPDDGEEN